MVKKEIEFYFPQNSISSDKVNSCLKEECCLIAPLCPLVQGVLHIANTSAEDNSDNVSRFACLKETDQMKDVEDCQRNP